MKELKQVPIHERWASDDASGRLPMCCTDDDEFEIRHNLLYQPEDEIETLVRLAKRNGTTKQVKDWLERHDWHWPYDDMDYFRRLNDVIEGKAD